MAILCRILGPGSSWSWVRAGREVCARLLGDACRGICTPQVGTQSFCTVSDVSDVLKSASSVPEDALERSVIGDVREQPDPVFAEQRNTTQMQ
jgi:hypothetical protein